MMRWCQRKEYWIQEMQNTFKLYQIHFWVVQVSVLRSGRKNFANSMEKTMLCDVMYNVSMYKCIEN